MNDTLFSTTKAPDYLLDFEYRGPSFDGVMEIVQLKNQLSGLENAITVIAQALARQKRISFNPTDIQIFVEAFEKGSFRDRVKIVLRSLKNLNQYQGAIALGVLFLEIIRIIPNYKAATIKEMSPRFISEVGDQVKIELLKNSDFLGSVASIVRPLEKNSDQLICSVPDFKKTTLNFTDKKEFLELAGEVETKEEIKGDRFEILQGRINRVDLDARVRHIGFKINNEGGSIPATLVENLRKPSEMRNLLGKWVELEGTTTYQGGARGHININKYKIIGQEEIRFGEKE